MEGRSLDKLIEQVAELAMEVDFVDKIDWGTLNVSKKQAFVMMAENTVKQFVGLDPNTRDIVMMSTMTKLLVENFVLNLLLKQTIDARRNRD